MNRIDFEDLGQGHKERRGEQHGGQRLDEDAEQEEGDIHQKEEHPRLVGHALDPFSQLHRNLFRGHRPGEASRRADDQHHHRFFWDNRSPSLEWLTRPRELYAPNPSIYLHISQG